MRLVKYLQWKISVIRWKMSFINDYLNGGFNMPSEKEVNNTPSHVSEKDLQHLFSEDDITKAKEPKPKKIKKSWFRGSLTTPVISTKKLDKYLRDRNITHDFSGNVIHFE